MKEDWTTIPIKKTYLEFHDGPHATPKPSSTGAIYLGIGNITEDGRLDFSQIRYIAEEDIPKWTKRVTPAPGDIVFTYEATLNRYAIIPEGFWGCLGRRLALIRPNLQMVDGRFLFYYFFGQEWRNIVAQKMIGGSTVDRIPLIEFPNFEITLPPLETQRKIAAILSAYDDAIENNTHRINLLEQAAHDLYREWFVHFRFPGHESVEMVESELGLIPAGWSVIRVSEAVEISPRMQLDKSAEKSFISMGRLSENSMLIDTSNMEYRAGNNGAKFQNFDTLFARITPCLENGKTGYVQFLAPEEAATGSTEFVVMRSRTLSPEYVYCLARVPEFRLAAERSMTGATGRQRVHSSFFDEYQIPQPDQCTLTHFGDFVTPLFSEIHVLTQKNDNLRETRDFLLPRLVSGQVDVAELDIETGETDQ